MGKLTGMKIVRFVETGPTEWKIIESCYEVQISWEFENGNIKPRD